MKRASLRIGMSGQSEVSKDQPQVPDFFPLQFVSGQVPVQFSLELLDQIRRAAIEALQTGPSGCRECAGLLYGRRSEQGLEIYAAQPLTCDDTGTSSFVLDAATLRSLESADKQLSADLELMGWYRSQTGAHDVTSDDRKALKALGLKRGVALIVSPSTDSACSGKLYSFSKNEVHPDPAQFPLPVANSATASAMIEPLDAPVEPDLPVETTIGVEIEPAAEYYAVREVAPLAPVAAPVSGPALNDVATLRSNTAIQRESQRNAARSGLEWGTKLLLCSAATLMIVFLVALVKVVPEGAVVAAQAPAPAFALDVSETDGKIQVRWDAADVAWADGGTIDLVDGPTRIIRTLDENLLHKGVYEYPVESSRIDVRMILKTGDRTSLQEAVLFAPKRSASR